MVNKLSTPSAPESPSNVTKIISALQSLDSDIVRRNEYMNLRDRFVYGEGLTEKLEVEGWFAEYNYLERVVDIHTAQLMGRPFKVYSYYDKEDVSDSETDPAKLQFALLENKRRKAAADGRKNVIEAIERDNGGEELYKDGARIGSAYGLTAYKQWFDKTENRIKRVLIETPQNLYISWKNNDFRDYDFVAYVYQISKDSAQRDYGDKLKDGDQFQVTKEGSPLVDAGTGGSLDTSTPISQLSRTADKDTESTTDMVTVIDFNGYLPGTKDPISLLIVGGYEMQRITEKKLMPKYYLIPNRKRLRRAVPASDISQSAMDINREIVQLEADKMTWASKTLFKKFQAKGFTPEAIPKFKPRRTQVVAMGPEQSLDEVNMAMGELQAFNQLIESKMQAFVRVTGVGRVLFDDPTVEANSNQALMTMLKPVIDIVEDKQARWTPKIIEMNTDALVLSAEHFPELKDLTDTEENWFLCVEWPSVLRREDSSYQSMWLNRVMQGLISLETYMEKMGDDYTEEMDRLADEMHAKVPAAILGKQLGLIAQLALQPPMPAAPAPDQYSPQVGVDQNTEQTQAPSIPGSGQPQVSPEGAVAQIAQNNGA